MSGSIGSEALRLSAAALAAAANRLSAHAKEVTGSEAVLTGRNRASQYVFCTEIDRALAALALLGPNFRRQAMQAFARSCKGIDDESYALETTAEQLEDLLKMFVKGFGAYLASHVAALESLSCGSRAILIVSPRPFPLAVELPACISNASHITVDLSGCAVSIDGPDTQYFTRGGLNTASVHVFDSQHAPLKSLSPADLLISTTSKCSDENIPTRVELAGPGVLFVSFTPPDSEDLDEVQLAVLPHGTPASVSPLFQCTLLARRTIAGRYLTEFPVSNQVGVEHNGYGFMTVARDGTQLAAANFRTGIVWVYELPSGAFVRRFGGNGNGPSQFLNPDLACCTADGHLLVSDRGNNRVHEVKFDGAFVRFVGVGVIDMEIEGIAENGQHIVVAKSCEDAPQHGCILLFEFHSGAFVRRFGAPGSRIGEIGPCIGGIRFLPGGQQFMFADLLNRRISVHAVADGAHIRSFGADVLAGPDDVDVACNGDIVVTDAFGNSICVFDPTGETLLRRFDGSVAGGTGGAEHLYTFQPTACAVIGRRLYVTDRATTRVVVFE